jgi:membrane-associated phospholipid phosphatase
MRISLKPVDILSLSFIALLCFITILFIPAHKAWGGVLPAYALLAAAIVALAVYRKNRPSGKGPSFLYPAAYVVIILVLFNSLGDIIPSLWGRTFDDILIRTDVALFNGHPTLWMEKLINPMLTTLFQLAYISYYFMPLSLGALLIAKHRDRELDEAMFGIVLCFYLSYLGYLLVPAIGPRFTLAHLQTMDLQAGPVTRSIQGILNSLEHNKTDAFPSGHTAIALMSLYYAWKHRERTLFRILLPLVSLLIFSTVYLRYHYVIDVIAGVLLAVLTIFLAPRAYRFLSPNPPQG